MQTHYKYNLSEHFRGALISLCLYTFTFLAVVSFIIANEAKAQTANENILTECPSASITCPPESSCPSLTNCSDLTARSTEISPTPITAIPTVSGESLFKINLKNIASSEFITFGQPFKKGDLPAGYTLAGVQLDKKSTFSDGSLRFGVISLLANEPTKSFYTVAKGTPAATETTADLAGLTVKVVANNKTVTLDTTKPNSQWLKGHIVNEWRYHLPIDSNLVAKLNIRKYTGSNNIRVDVVIENSYTFQPGPQNITYDTEIFINGVSKYKKRELNHYHHSKWRKVLWSGAVPKVHIKHDIDYLLRTKAVANYDKTAVAHDRALAGKYRKWRNSNHDPMGISIVRPTMGVAGGRPDIGPLPGWATTYLLSQDKRAKEIMLSIGDLSGSYPIHYKDKNTDKPVSIRTYPNVSLYFRSKRTGNNPLPRCGGDCKVPFKFESAHQPSFVFLPYLVTGDQYYIEELQYWANVNHLLLPDMFRDNEKGLFHRSQIRGMAWSMRTLAQAAAFTPDSDTTLKTYFTTLLENNRANFETLLVGDRNNKLGVNPLGYGIPYNKFRGVSVWMDGFFTWAMAYMVDLDFIKFKPLFKFKAQLPINMMTDPKACWIHASLYFLNVRDLADSRPFRYTPTNQPVDYKMYPTLAQAYQESLPKKVRGTECNSPAMLAAYRKIKIKARDKFVALDTMIGWPKSIFGHPALLQPALAVSVDLTGNIAAWNKFQSRKKKPKYNRAAMWAILPRIIQP